ncbi:MAG: PQQ-dependent sugar dehydrogenase [Gammaproteobacteria bacterium]|nr:PQQ-dependent sugar dehydrogenase [Gammaproteobacteria bacterium]
MPSGYRSIVCHSLVLAAIFSILPACGPSAGNGQSTLAGAVTYQNSFAKLSFKNPTTLLQQPGDNSRWYVLEKSGRVYYFANNEKTAVNSLYLDISNSRVDESFEGGLLGMAFDPDFNRNHFVYLSYTGSGDPRADNSETLRSYISRFTVNKDNTRIDPESEAVILTIDQPWNNHNGGNILFGPDGLLYAGYGDGGGWGDQKNNAQNIDTLLGAMLRIDVRGKPAIGGDAQYAIPPDNPFASSPGCGSQRGCPEIYAWGFRNPWRWSFDRQSGQLWVGDVGQGEWEEIDRVEKGKNYGWRCYEGRSRYNFEECSKSIAYAMPIAIYQHMPFEKSRDGMAASVTGGFVYRGDSLSALQGSYLYADFVHGKIWALPNPYGKNPEPVLLLDTDFNIVSFAEDNNGEIYFLSYGENGGIFKLLPAKSSANK